MKRRAAATVAAAMVVTMGLTGCQASKGLETEEIKITQYNGVEVSEVEKAAEVTDEEIESAINDTLTANATITEVKDREVKSGDTVNIDFVGKMDGEKFDGGSGEGYDLKIGSDTFIDGFEDSVIGHEIGDKYDWNGTFPEDYTEELAGKDVTFTITVNSISVQEVPELTDEFVQKVSEESKTVDEYREEVKKNLEETAQSEYENNLINEIWTVVLENTEVLKYPEDEVEEMKNNVIEYYKSYAEAYGTEYETLIEEQMGQTVEEFETQIEEYAKASISQEMAIEAIADKEKIKMDDATYEKELEEIAAAQGMDVETLKSSYEEDQLKSAALGNLVNDFLIKNCIQVTE